MSEKFKEYKALLSWATEAPNLQIGFKETVYYLIWKSFKKDQITYEEYLELTNDSFLTRRIYI